MSRFFSSVDDEKAEGKKATIEEKIYETAEKQSKKEKRLNDLQCKVLELEEEENQKLFDKQLKKIFVDIKKTENYFEGKLPSFLRKFLTSPRAYNKTHKTTIDELLSKYEQNKTDSVEDSKKEEEKVRKDLDNILVIKDLEQRKNELAMFKDNADDNFPKSRALMTLLSIYMKAGDEVSIMETMGELADCFGEDDVGETKPIFLKNIDFYMEAIYENLSSSGLQIYSELLDKLLPLDRMSVEKRLLQLKFFKLKQTPKTDDPLFKLVYINRTQPYDSANEYYKSIREKITTGSMDLEILQEFGISAFKHGDFVTSFGALSMSSERFPERSRFELKLLCVILNDRIKESPIYKKFLEGFRDLGKNRFCLPSGDDVLEIYRSFYLLNMYDRVGASSVIGRYCKDFDGSVWFDDFIHSRLIKNV